MLCFKELENVWMFNWLCWVKKGNFPQRGRKFSWFRQLNPKNQSHQYLLAINSIFLYILRIFGDNQPSKYRKLAMSPFGAMANQLEILIRAVRFQKKLILFDWSESSAGIRFACGFVYPFIASIKTVSETYSHRRM